MTSIRDAARSDPVGAGFVVCAAALVTLLLLQVLPQPDAEAPHWRLPDILRQPAPAARPLTPPPIEWRRLAGADDVLAVPGHHVAYWGRPDASYGQRATVNAARPVAIVVHYTDDRPMLALIKQQHEGDHQRGGYAYGYHMYVDKAGRIAQGAPLGVRTNHIKPHGSPQHRAGAPALDNEDAIGITLVGACRSPILSPMTYRCSEETITPEQMEAAMAVVKALQARFALPCAEIFGHGDLQEDRQAFEGVTLSRRVRAGCTMTTAGVHNG